MTTTRFRPLTAQSDSVSHSLATSNGRPPPATHRVPPARGASDPPAQALISVTGESIRTGMDVYDYHGVHVGRVKDVLDTSFQVARRWRRDIHVPLEQVLAVVDKRVILTVPRLV